MRLVFISGSKLGECLIIMICSKILIIRKKLATELVILKVCNVKPSFNIWLVLYIYFILYF